MEFFDLINQHLQQLALPQLGMRAHLPAQMAEELGRIGLVDFADRARLCKVGSNLFDAAGTQAETVTPRFRTNSIESSTVDPTKAMVAMIEVSRAYEMNANLVGLADTTLGRAVNDIARIG